MPVFVQPSGRRARRARVIGVAAAIVCCGYGLLIAVSLLGIQLGPLSPALPGGPHGHPAAAPPSPHERAPSNRTSYPAPLATGSGSPPAAKLAVAASRRSQTLLAGARGDRSGGALAAPVAPLPVSTPVSGVVTAPGPAIEPSSPPSAAGGGPTAPPSPSPSGNGSGSTRQPVATGRGGELPAPAQAAPASPSGSSDAGASRASDKSATVRAGQQGQLSSGR